MDREKIVFITGAASGIGLEIARAFATNGHKVVLTDIDLGKIEEVCSSLEKMNLKVTGFRCDVSSEADIIDAIEKTLALFGRIDVVINGAGIQYVAPIEIFPTDKFEKLIKIMLVAPFIITKNVFPVMKQQKWGRIINIASINGLVGFAGKAAYNSAKHGVIGLTKVAALEGASFGITVNALCPGYVDTPLVRNQLADLARERSVALEEVLNEVIYLLVPQKRLLEVAEITDYVMFLASENAKGVTGQAVVIDGGYVAQ
ncbi:3-hydroxybutyrate dehydrogenase [Pedobacter sp.]